MQDHCEARLLGQTDLLQLAAGKLPKAILWSSVYDADGPLHMLCCNNLLTDLEQAREQGALAKIANAEECRNPIVAGLLICLNNRLEGGQNSRPPGLVSFAEEQ